MAILQDKSRATCRVSNRREVTFIQKYYQYCDNNEHRWRFNIMSCPGTIDNYSVVFGKFLEYIQRSYIQRKIRSTRNHIHCNLFLAWIFNTIFKCLLFVQGNNWAHLLNGCAITILAVYGSIIQMSWTLIEGIHLHLLLSISHFPKTWSFKCFITCAIICYL
ncbi:Oidioi.mRNA.OKI2018_I69.XSR.g14334.t1.cds [Oikopleura dioica]|uniref:Oidioi.mRNA.OKI2018_I69.XSR.g14334.t1.cds n=1 Tax=Oikopleura dioica TaxID=34765 RepID=A0ABN7SFS5_OIKDI|nr:Oidioi.mRNA.OKI2018_I69.XSR.g14334.t1.cds [Oikopleura dioica]